MFGLRGRGARRQSRIASRNRTFETLEQKIALSAAPTVVDVAVAGTQWTPAYYQFLGDNSLGTMGYSIPVGSASQAIALPWKNIDQIRIKFSEDVNVQASDMALSGVNSSSHVFADFFYDPQSRIATWTLPAPLTKDRFLIDLDADGIGKIADLDCDVLDGEWVNNSDTYLTGGNVSEGGDFEFLFNVLPGEVNSTTQVTSVDYLYTRSQEGKSTTSAGYNFKYDVNGSGLIDSADWQFVQGKMGNSLPAGSPVGVVNDAPSAAQIEPVSISNAAVDVAISLWDHFDDNENGATGLTYSIASNTAASLFDYVSINSTTGQLVLNAKANVSGTAKVTVAATDSGGISTRATLQVGVNFDNQPPMIIYPMPEYLFGNMWRFSGTVVDDQDPTGLIVVLYHTFDARAAVYPDGTFQIVVELTEEQTGDEFMRISDRFNEWSNDAYVYIGP